MIIDILLTCSRWSCDVPSSSSGNVSFYLSIQPKTIWHAKSAQAGVYDMSAQAGVYDMPNQHKPFCKGRIGMLTVPACSAAEVDLLLLYA